MPHALFEFIIFCLQMLVFASQSNFTNCVKIYITN